MEKCKWGIQKLRALRSLFNFSLFCNFQTSNLDRLEKILVNTLKKISHVHDTIYVNKVLDGFRGKSKKITCNLFEKLYIP